MKSRSSRLFFLAPVLALLFATLGRAEEKEENSVPYGRNEEKGRYAEINGIRMYYEVYGEGQPLLLIHGNSGSIESMQHQIVHFSQTHQVIVADSHGHGKSELGEGKLTYLGMAGDYAKLIETLELDAPHVLGFSDGGIIGLLLGIHHPDRVSKIAVMGANLNPGPDAVYEWAPQAVQMMLEVIQARIEAQDESQDWNRTQQVLKMLVEQPNISVDDLKKVKSPVLVLAGDRDIIREEHSVLIYQSLPRAHLCIFPGATHFLPARDPELFNLTVERFLTRPFKRPDSKDTLMGKE